MKYKFLYVVLGSILLLLIASSITQKLTYLGLTDDQIALARAFAEHAPLMALAGTEPAALLDSIDALEDARDGLAKLQGNTIDTKLIRKGLFPTRFLKALSELEEQRIFFIENATRESLAAYDKAMDKAFASYYADISAHRNSFLVAVPHDALSYIAGNARVSRQDILDALNSLENGVRHTEVRMINRRNCIRGNAELCDPSDAAFPLAEIPENESEKKLSETAKTVLSIYEGARPNMTTSVLSTSKGVCTETFPGSEHFALMHNTSLTLPIYLGDLRLIKIGAVKEQSFYQYFYERDIEYVSAPPILPYLCPEFAGEFAHLLAVHALEKSDENTAGKSTSFNIQWVNNSTDFDAIVHYAAYIGRTIANARDSGAPGPDDVATIFYTRSSFLALFLAHNPSVTGEHKRFFSTVTAYPEETPFVFFSNLPERSSLIPSLIESQKEFDTVHGLTS